MKIIIYTDSYLIKGSLILLAEQIVENCVQGTNILWRFKSSNKWRIVSYFSYVSVMQQEDSVEASTITQQPVTEDTRNGVAVDNELESETSALAVGGAQPLINGSTDTLLECSDENEYLNKELDPLEESKNASDITKHSSKINNGGKKPVSSAVKVI